MTYYLGILSGVLFVCDLGRGIGFSARLSDIITEPNFFSALIWSLPDAAHRTVLRLFALRAIGGFVAPVRRQIRWHRGGVGGLPRTRPAIELSWPPSKRRSVIHIFQEMSKN